jgi:hypothetical protein
MSAHEPIQPLSDPEVSKAFIKIPKVLGEGEVHEANLDRLPRGDNGAGPGLQEED